MPGRDPKLPDTVYKAMQGVMDTLFAQADEKWVIRNWL